jgi:rod shape-determining protein MreD
VLYLGLRGRGASSQLVVVALACGYLADLFAGSPRGLESLSLAIVVLLARGASNRLMVVSSWQVIAVAAAGALLHSLCVFLLSSMYAESLGVLRVAPKVALFTGLLAAPLFALFRRVDRRFLTDPHRLHIVHGAR